MPVNLDPKTLFCDVQSDNPVIIAVSGGSDSIALLLLASAWAHHSDVLLQVVTVDHGLRPEAAAEAAFVAGVCEGLDLPHVTLAWEGIKPESGISQAARNARYMLLEEFANDIGTDTIITGHTANDQAETVFMRIARDDVDGSGRGLAGMADVTILPGNTRLVRPLLMCTRDQLRSYLREHNQSWIEDPSNSDQAYERVRVRNILETSKGDVFRYCRFASVMGRYRKQLSSDAANLLDRYLTVADGNVFTITDGAFQPGNTAIQVLAMQVVIAMAGGGEFMVPERVVAGFLADHSSDRITVGKCVLERYRDGIRIYRENRNLPVIMLDPGDRQLWDGRVLIENNTSSLYYCGPLSAAQVKELELERGRKFPVKPRIALQTIPFLRGDGDELYLPFVKGFERPAKLIVKPVVRAIEYFCPQHDYPLLEWLQKFRARSGTISAENGSKT